MSMGLAIALLGLTTLAVALLLVPLILRGRAAQARDAYNLAVYRDQLAEIDRDVERGILSADEAAAAKSEIGRRILALEPTEAAAAPSRAPLVVAAVAILVLPFAAWTLYWDLGSPSLADQPFAAHQVEAAQTAQNGNPHADMADAVKKLTAHLQVHPDDLEGWLLLARSDLDLDQYTDAVEAYRRAADLSGQKPEIVGDWGEAQVLAAGGTVTAEAKQAFETALADKESAPRSRYYLALAKEQAGDVKGALQDWVDLEADSPSDAEWLPLLRRRIAAATKTAGVDPATLKTSAGVPRKPPPAAAANPPAAPPQQAAAPAPAPTQTQSESGMPSTAEVAETAKATQGMSEQDRKAMIEGMVGKLAARLQQNPGDTAGWVQLGRSYMVLDQPDKAADAYAQAAKLKPDDIDLKQQYADAIVSASGGDDPPEAATALFRQVLDADPKNAESLWYVGLAEAAAGHAQSAHDLWTRLLAQLPESAPIRQQVQDRIAALKLDAGK
ncbi:MAG TPA: c-type cytochrome biogenesis protein CcmI [Stellaceae bacterium]|nr:c-type cytochrome biogenesis protein CcmI [Stellaceae bacterium]